jgi:hypothetical protein
MGKFLREIDGMLAGAAADFQNLSAVGKTHAQHLEDGVFVALAGGGEGEHGTSILLFSQVASKMAPLG